MLSIGMQYVNFYDEGTFKAKNEKKKMLTVVILFLCVTHGLGENGSCKLQNIGTCSLTCVHVRSKCAGNKECAAITCSQLYPLCYPRMDCPTFLIECWSLEFDCLRTLFGDNTSSPSKRGLMHKNIAYLLLKLHPYFNQSSQFGFLSSGRFRRISGNFGTEFLGKRGKSDGSQRMAKAKSRFTDLPEFEISPRKISKRENINAVKRLTVRQNGSFGSEFLGKRAYDRADKIRKLVGSEFMGKREDFGPFDGSHFSGEGWQINLGGSEFLGKRLQNDMLIGSELLGKKNNLEEKKFSGSEILWRRHIGNELLG